MAGLDPAILVFLPWSTTRKDVDARVEPGHDEVRGAGAFADYLRRQKRRSRWHRICL